MRVVFMGSGALGCPTLCSMLADQNVDVVAVVTQPDRPKGRRLKTSPCALRASLTDDTIPVLTPVKVNDPDSLAALRALRPDVITVVAYGQKLSPELLDIPGGGCLNLHASLLPRYRGAAPVQWSIANGDKETGVTSMYMSEGLDEGDIILQKSETILDDDTAQTLHDRLADVGAGLMLNTLEAVRSGTVVRMPQNPDAATFAPKLKKSDGRIDWSAPAELIDARVRGFNPWPCCFCLVKDARHGDAEGVPLRVLSVKREDGVGFAGDVLDVSAEGPLVATGSGAVRLTCVQPAGRKVMTGGAYINGYGLKPGERLS